MRAGVHGHADIRLSKRGSVICAVASHSHEFSLCLFSLDKGHLVFRCSFREEIVDSRLAGNRSRGKRVVARDHHRANPHSAQMIEAFLHAPLHNVCTGYRAQYSAALCNQQRCSTRIRDFSDIHMQLGGNAIAVIAGQAADSL